MNRKLAVFIIFIGLLNQSPTSAQLCSCPEPEPAFALDCRPIPRHTWQFAATVDYKNLSRLVMNSSQKADDSRTRSTKSLSFSVKYGISNRLSASAILNVVQKSVELRLPTVGREYLRTRGLGDSYILSEYTFILWDLAIGRKLSAGAGFKLPTGRKNYESDEILIHEDMQPGTGAFGGLLFGNAIIKLHPQSPAYLYLDTYFMLNAKNNNDYKYGNEFSGAAGFLFLPEYVGRLTAYVKFRSAGKHKDSLDMVISNTGGRWFFLVWDVRADIKKNLFGKLEIQFPLKHDLEGTQLTVDYDIKLAFQYSL